jgi:hypothetical protein
MDPPVIMSMNKYMYRAHEKWRKKRRKLPLQLCLDVGAIFNIKLMVLPQHPRFKF